MSALPRNPEKILRRLEWTVIRRLDGMLHGDYRTLFRGNGIDLADLREYQYHDDVLDMALDVLRHRIVLSFEALSDDISADDLLRTILGRIPVPVVPLRDHGTVHVNA